MKDVNGFIYGPFSTRFWMMRIGVNQLIAENSLIKKPQIDKKTKKNKVKFTEEEENQEDERLFSDSDDAIGIN